MRPLRFGGVWQDSTLNRSYPNVRQRAVIAMRVRSGPPRRVRGALGRARSDRTPAANLEWRRAAGRRCPPTADTRARPDAHRRRREPITTIEDDRNQEHPPPEHAIPEDRRRLIADPSAVGPVIEEVLRLELPAPITPRVVTQDVDVCGTRIPAGAQVALCLATANREPGWFAQPDEIGLDQADGGHLAFGGGIHRCLGSHLARRELRLVVEEFHKLIPDYEVAPGSDPQVAWPSGTLHLTSLPLVFPVKSRP